MRIERSHGGGTMSTTMNFNLSAALQNTVASGTGVYVYVFAFGASTENGPVSLVTQATLVSDGQLDASSITLPSPNFYSGAVYVVIQQGGDGTLPSSISAIGDINPTNAAASNYSYQLFEATLSGSGDDQGDISAVNTFGMTSAYEVVFQDGSTDQRGFNASAHDIFGALDPDAVANYTNNSFPDPERLATGPATANDKSPWDWKDWERYVNKLKFDHKELKQIEIVASFNGGTSLQDDPMLSHYRVEYVRHDKYGHDYFWLIPETKHGANNHDWIRIPVKELMHNIYEQTGKLIVHKGGKDGDVHVYDSFTPNNAVGQVAEYFVAGFDAGFWGGHGTSPNPLVTEEINFNKSVNWTVNYAYNAALNPDAVDYHNALGHGAGTAGGHDRFYDPWAKEFLINSNAYGYSYSDLVSDGGVNPQVTLWDAGAGTNVQTINITLFDTGETPGSGYKASTLPYIAPQDGSYESSLTLSTNQIGFTFNFELGGSLKFTPHEDTPIHFKFYAPDSDQADADGFVDLHVTSSNGDWNYYSIVNNADGSWSLEATNTAGEDGFFNIQNLPVTSDGSVSWYQLVFGEHHTKTVYNIYAEFHQGTQNIKSLTVDHGVGVTAGQTSNTYALNFAPGGEITYDIATLGEPGSGQDWLDFFMPDPVADDSFAAQMYELTGVDPDAWLFDLMDQYSAGANGPDSFQFGGWRADLFA